MPDENDLNSPIPENKEIEPAPTPDNTNSNTAQGFDEVAYEQGLIKDEAKLSILQEEYSNIEDRLHDEFESILENNPKALFSSDELDALASDPNIAAKNKMLRDGFEKFRDERLSAKKDEITKFEDLLKGRKAHFELASLANKFAKENPTVDMEALADFINDGLNNNQKKELRDTTKSRFEFLVGANELFKKAKGENENAENLPPDLNELNGATGNGTFNADKERRDYLKSIGIGRE